MRIILLLLFFLPPFLLLAQENDLIWQFGYGQSWNEPGLGGSLMDFRTIPPTISPDYRLMNFMEANASFCDNEGQLLFYTNGLSVANAEDEQMENGDGLNPGQMADDMLGMGYLHQSAMALPSPAGERLYYLFHSPQEYPDDFVDWHSPFLYATAIDMNLNGGLGKVTDKNMPIIADTLDLSQCTAARHANGRDWWVLNFRQESGEYYRVLVDGDGVHNLGTESVEIETHRDGVGQTVFSPNGEFYVTVNSVNSTLGTYLDIYRFDRCTGTLGQPVQINYGDNVAAGVAISPSSRFLYVSSALNLYQYDLQANDIPGSVIKIAEYDGFLDGTLSTTFYLCQLAPDGKIYLSATNGTRYLHVIHQPDMPYPACNVEQHGIMLPTDNALSMPNFPNYRLGPLDGSPCDTLGLDNLPVAKYRYDQDSIDFLQVAFTDLSYYEPAEWEWDFGGTGTSNEKNPVHTFPSGGTYEVCLTVGNDNGGDTFCRTLQLGTVATGETEKEIGIALFPNPAKEAATIEWDTGRELPEELTVRLFDLMGRELLAMRSDSQAGLVTFETDNLKTGVYFIELSGNGETLFSEKLLIQ